MFNTLDDSKEVLSDSLPGDGLEMILHSSVPDNYSSQADTKISAAPCNNGIYYDMMPGVLQK